MTDLLLMLAGPLLLIHILYIIAVLKTDFSVIDIGWGLGFVLIGSIGAFLSDFTYGLENLLFALIALWGLRLAGFLYLRNKGRPEDYRYKDMRTRWKDKANRDAYFKVFLLQYGLMLIVALPIFSAHFAQKSEIGVMNLLGVLVSLFGLLWESVADAQKNAFKKRPGNAHKLCNQGLWSLSRHPNYFGEILFWYGIFFVSFHGERFWSLLGPLFIHFLLLKVSGIPLIEKKHENDPEYEAYKKTTPKLVPALSKLQS